MRLLDCEIAFLVGGEVMWCACQKKTDGVSLVTTVALDREAIHARDVEKKPVCACAMALWCIYSFLLSFDPSTYPSSEFIDVSVAGSTIYFRLL